MGIKVKPQLRMGIAASLRSSFPLPSQQARAQRNTTLPITEEENLRCNL